MNNNQAGFIAAVISLSSAANVENITVGDLTSRTRFFAGILDNLDTEQAKSS